jgi:catechol 2,3-dioxygenase-like lactoylglutathione lyase family enzyme
MISGINHITLSVSNLERSIEFYCHILGYRLIAKWNKGAYLEAGNLWLCLYLDRQARQESLPEYSHIAFHVEPDVFASLAEKIKNSGANIWKENTSEGNSLYFLDPDFHKLEIHSSNLADRLAACKQKPYDGMEFY